MRVHAMIISSFSLVLASTAVVAVEAADTLPLSDKRFPWPTTAVVAVSSTPTSNDPSSTASPSFFSSTWRIPSITLGKLAYIQYEIDNHPYSNPQLVLCQTSATGDTNVTSENSWTVTQISVCGRSLGETCSIGLHDNTITSFTLQRGIDPGNLDNFFFCLALRQESNPNGTGAICESYSQFFDIQESTGDTPKRQDLDPSTTAAAVNPPTNTAAANPPLNTPQSVLTIINGRQVLVNSDSGSLEGQATPTPSIVTQSIVTTSASPSTVATVTTTPTAVSSSDQPTKKSSSGLSTGAKVGIALGAVAFVLILLILGLLCLRRKRSKRNQPEQVMLTRSMHTDSFSRNLIMEKEDPGVASTIATPIDEPPVILAQSPTQGQRERESQRHSALATYAAVPSAPYTGTAASIPRRKPTAATMASTVSRGLSTTSGTSSSGARSGSEGFEQYHDVVPIYGDARHVPQVFPGNTRSMQSPFLSEEGMTPEEVARLEEEERRIDAAIAEAERRS